MNATSSIPTYEELRARLNTNFTLSLHDGAGGQVIGELVGVEPGIAMNTRYQCYIAEFVLPVGVNAPQATYDVRPCDAPEVTASGWQFLLSPTVPDDAGRGQLHAVFHVAISSAAAGQKPIVLEGSQV